MTNPQRLADATTLRPRRVGEILDAAMVLWVEHFKVLTALAASLLLPFQVISVLVASSAKPSFADALQTWQKELNAAAAENPPRFVWPHLKGVTIASFAGAGVITFIGTYVLTAALTVFIADAHLRRQTDRGRSLRVALRRGPVMMLSALVWVVIALGVMLLPLVMVLVDLPVAGLLSMLVLIPLGLWLGVRLSAGGPAVVIERAGPVGAIRRSFTLTKGRFWAVLGTTVLVSIVTTIPAAIISGLISSILSALGGHNAGFEFVWTAIAQTVATALTAPVTAAVAVILYFDLRVRREAFDLEQLAQSTFGE